MEVLRRILAVSGDVTVVSRQHSLPSSFTKRPEHTPDSDSIE
ncbi:hypothetical protein Pla52n_00290 [Stieleria varia]|uniref:Uncharacterized protein n=1 Tax=Stieleria varia TaxID=2528005 RepID=A0A5C6B876_9BACT|nr:hypothetical protein Pla52n_00290 [Stieleria varia]